MKPLYALLIVLALMAFAQTMDYKDQVSMEQSTPTIHLHKHQRIHKAGPTLIRT